jgi:hypothetical protein
VNNSSLGYNSLEFVTTGNNNTAIGSLSCNSISTGSYNTCLGSGEDTKTFTGTNETLVGFGAQGAGSNTVTIGNSDVTDVYLGCGYGCSGVANAAIHATNLGTWGALNYPTWTTGTPFVKMTAAGTFALDTNTYGTFTLPSLTSGSVLFSNGSTIAQNNANFFWDATNHRLGIGTASPGYKLDVQGDIHSTNSTINISTDLNSLLGTGNYAGYNLTNSPSGTGWVMVNNFSNGIDQVGQIAYDQYQTQKMYTRYSIDGGTGWSAWKTIINSDALSGTTNYVPKFTSAASIGDSSIYDNGNVSIGDTTATSMFNVGTANQFQVTSTGVSSAGAGSTDLNGSGVPEAHCLTDGTGCPSLSNTIQGGIILTTATSDSTTLTYSSAYNAASCVFSPTNSTATLLTILPYLTSLATTGSVSVTINHAATVGNGATYNIVCSIWHSP